MACEIYFPHLIGISGGTNPGNQGFDESQSFAILDEIHANLIRIPCPSRSRTQSGTQGCWTLTKCMHAFFSCVQESVANVYKKQMIQFDHLVSTQSTDLKMLNCSRTQWKKLSSMTYVHVDMHLGFLYVNSVLSRLKYIRS
jgi:hypothetical protein